MEKTEKLAFILEQAGVLCGSAVYGAEGAKLVKAFRNIPGVEITNVERLNLLKLAPSGHLGRFITWTESAFEKLDSIYGTFDKASEKKRGYVLPWAKVVNADLACIINSDEMQSVVKSIKKEVKRAPMKKNPLKNLNTMLRLNLYAKTAKRMIVLAEEHRKKAKKENFDAKRKPISKVMDLKLSFPAASTPRKQQSKNNEQQLNAPPAASATKAVSNMEPIENNIHEEEAEGCSIYIRGLPMSATPALLGEEFKKFGALPFRRLPARGTY